MVTIDEIMEIVERLSYSQKLDVLEQCKLIIGASANTPIEPPFAPAS